MKDNFNLSLKRMWLAISAFSLILPVFMPSSANPEHFFENVIGMVTVILFILSFPASLLGLLVLFFAKIFLDVNLNSIEGLYLNLFVLFALGLVQWFWIVPRLMRNDSGFQRLNLPGTKSEMQMSEANSADEAKFRAFQEQSPLERVFQEKDS